MDPQGGRAGLNTRQIDENQVFNLAATRPDLLTGFNPATGQPEPYGSVGVDINCAVIGYTATGPHRQPRPPGTRLPVPAQVTGKPPQALPRPCGRTGGTAPQSPRGPAIAGPREAGGDVSHLMARDIRVNRVGLARSVMAAPLP